MAFSRPTLSELITRTQEDFQSRLQLKGKIVRNTFVWIFARVYAGLAHGLYGFISWVADQILPDTASDENLVRIGTIYGITRNAASFAQGEVTVTGIAGTTVPAGTVLERADGIEFSVINEVTLAAITDSLEVRAIESGDDGNTEVGVNLAFQTPITNIEADTTVSVEVGGGADIEDLEDYRARILARMSNPLQGGSAADYEAWALEVSGVTRAWVKPLYLGDGTVATFFVRDDDDSIFPSVSEVATVSGYIEERRPVTAHQYVYAPTGVDIDFSIYLTPDTQSVKEAVTGELFDLIYRDGEPGGTILLSRMNEAISLAQGETDHLLASPSADFTASDGYLPQLGTVTFL